MKATGACQCGGIRYELDGEPLLTYACHCRDCQRRTGSAFSEGILVLADHMAIEGELQAWRRVSDTGVEKIRHSCASCGNIIYGTAANMPGLMLLQAGTLNDTRAVHPDVHLFLRSAQPWVILPPGIPSWNTQPDDMTELLEAAVKYRHSR